MRVAIIATDYVKLVTGACLVDLGHQVIGMARPLLLDGRNAWDREALTALGFEYHGIGRGRPPVTPTRTP